MFDIKELRLAEGGKGGGGGGDEYFLKTGVAVVNLAQRKGVRPGSNVELYMCRT